MFRVLLVLVLAASSGQSAETVPKRIISTAPGITEILFALGLGDRVAGVTEYCKYPPPAAKLPRIGSWTSPNLEVMASLRPDLVIVQKTAVHDAARFQGLFRTLEVHLDRVPDIFAAIESIGAVTGVPDRARELNHKIRSDLDSIRSRVSGRPAVPVLFVVGRTPGTLEGLIAVGPGSYLSELIGIAGGSNVLADASVPYVKVAHEEILARKPQVIVDMGEHAEAAGITESQRRSEIALWNVYPSLPAVRDKRVHILASDIFVVPGPRVTECAAQLARLLHPESFR